MTAFLLGLLIGLLIGLVAGTLFGIYLLIRIIYKDGYAIKDGHLVRREEK